MDVVEPKIEFLEISEWDVIEPKKLRILGSVQGEPYIVEVNAPAAPAGTPFSAPSDFTTIVWDKRFYIKWEGGSGFDEYLVVVKDGTDIVYIADNLRANELTYDPNTSDLVNDTQYTIEVTGVQGGNTYDATPFNITPRDKSVTGLSYSYNDEGTEATITWTDLSTPYNYYNIKIYDQSTGELVFSKFQFESTSLVVSDLTTDQPYDIEVEVVSEQEIFTTVTTDAFTPIALPDAPGNFVATTSQAVSPFDDAITQYDITQLTGYSDGNKITQLTDVSGNGNHGEQASSAAQATYRLGELEDGTIPVADFNQHNYLATYGSDYSQPNTVFLIIKPDSASNFNFSIIDGVDTSSKRYFVGGFSANELLMFAGTTLSTNAHPGNDWMTLITKAEGVNSEIWLNNSLDASGDAGSNVVGGFTIGDRPGGSGTVYYQGFLMEFAHWDRELRDDERIWLNDRHYKDILGL